MVKCPSCGKEIPVTWTVCPFCGGVPREEGIEKRIVWPPSGAIPVPDWAKTHYELKLQSGDVIEIYGYKSVYARPTPYRLQILRDKEVRTADLQSNEIDELIMWLRNVKNFVEGV